MKNSTKKVIILENFNSPYICQAILILRDNAQGAPKDVVDAAERIVRDYIGNYSPTPPKPKYSKTKTAAAIFSVLSVIAAVGVWAINYLSI